MKTKKRKASLVVEIAIGLAVLGVILSVILPRYTDSVPSAKKSADIAQISVIVTAIGNYRQDMKTYPPNLQALVTKNGDFGPWLASLPATDQWGNTTNINGIGGGTSPYCYAFTADGFAVWSLGENKANNSGGGGSVLPAQFSGDDDGILEK